MKFFIGTKINLLFSCFILQFTASMLGFKVQLAPPKWKLSFVSLIVSEIWKTKVVSLSWNLVLRPTQMWRIQWWCSLFLFLNGSILFMANCQKMKIIWSWKIEPSLIQICRIWWWFLFYCFCRLTITFLG